MKNFLFGTWPACRASAGLLVLRIVAGAGLMCHGYPKLHNAFGWMGSNSHVPGFLQACSVASEFFGGLGLIVGLLTPLAALGVSINMIVALATVHIPHGDPFVAKPGGHSAELASMYLAIAIVILASGPGRFSLDALWAGPRNK